MTDAPRPTAALRKATVPLAHDCYAAVDVLAMLDECDRLIAAARREGQRDGWSRGAFWGGSNASATVGAMLKERDHHYPLDTPAPSSVNVPLSTLDEPITEGERRAAQRLREHIDAEIIRKHTAADTPEEPVSVPEERLADEPRTPTPPTPILPFVIIDNGGNRVGAEMYEALAWIAVKDFARTVPDRAPHHVFRLVPCEKPAPEPLRTKPLSDGSVWTYDPVDSVPEWRSEDGAFGKAPWPKTSPFTADDFREIARVLDLAEQRR